MDTVFLGTSEFAAAVLERLAASPHRPSLVITRPDRPAGRGQRLQSPPVADAAQRLGLTLAQPANVNSEEARGEIAAHRPGAVCVCAFGAIIREPLLSGYPMLNVHPSLLPRWRGAAPIERAIMAGDAETGVSIMHLEAGLDSGPVGLQGAEPIGPGDTYGTLSKRLEGLGGELLVLALDDRALPFLPQPEEGVTYAEKITAEDRDLDPRRSAQELERQVRALTPHIGARLRLPDGALLGVRRAALADPAEVTAGEVGALRGEGERLLLDCAPGVLELLEVQPAGGRPMDAGAYLRGRGAPG